MQGVERRDAFGLGNATQLARRQHDVQAGLTVGPVEGAACERVGDGHKGYVRAPCERRAQRSRPVGGQLFDQR
jgi:hypothetical protein